MRTGAMPRARVTSSTTTSAYAVAKGLRNADTSRRAGLSSSAFRIQFSGSPVEYRDPPPRLGEHTEAVLADLLGLGPEEIAALRARGVV